MLAGLFTRLAARLSPRPSRRELAERLARCEARLEGLRVEQGVVIAKGFVAIDAEGHERFAVLVRNDGATRFDLWQAPGEARVSACTTAGGAAMFLTDAAGTVRLGAGVDGESTCLGLHDASGVTRMLLCVDGDEANVRILPGDPKPETEIDRMPLHLGGYL